MNGFFNVFLNLFRFPLPDFSIGALVFLAVFVMVYNLCFYRRAYTRK